MFVFRLSLFSQSINILSDYPHKIYELNLETCEREYLHDINGIKFTDIAYHPDGNLYAINQSGQIHLVDTITGNTSVIVTFPFGIYTGLIAGVDSIFYACTYIELGINLSEIWSFNPTTGQIDSIGHAIGKPPGDMTYRNGGLYNATVTDDLVYIDIDSIENSYVEVDLGKPMQILGLTTTRICDDVQTYISRSNVGADTAVVYWVNWEEEVDTVICQLPYEILGSSHRTEYFNQYINIQPLMIDSINVQQPDCDNSNGVISIQAVGTSQISIEFNGEIYSNMNSLLIENVSEGEYSISITNGLGCQIDSLITVECQDLVKVNLLDQNNNLVISPNPVNEILYLSKKMKNITIISIEGIRQNVELSRDGNQINVSNLRDGLYFLQTENELMKFVKTH